MVEDVQQGDEAALPVDADADEEADAETAPADAAPAADAPAAG